VSGDRDVLAEVTRLVRHAHTVLVVLLLTAGAQLGVTLVMGGC
jgi:hypothetical protein